MKGFKGFNKDLKCINKQYEVGKVFEEKEAKICKNGMHFCENPFDVLNYYSLIDNEGNLNRFAKVEALDETFTDDNKKFCTKKLKIGVELNLKDFIKAGFDFLWEKSIKFNETIENSDEELKNKATSGNYSQVATSGYNSKVATSGDDSKVVTSGYNSQVATSGDDSQVATSGYNSQVATSGYNSQVATSGYNSKVATSGDDSKVATSGNYSKVATSGYNSKVATSGNYSQVALKGRNSVGANIGIDGIIKGKIGCWITLAEYKYDYELEKSICICVKSAQIDGIKLKEDIFYKLCDGEFVEVDD